MTKTHAAIQLLKLGPLTTREFREITRWSRMRCNNVLIRLRRQGKVSRVNVDGRPGYQVLA